jgi:hypothetical protein
MLGEYTYGSAAIWAALGIRPSGRRTPFEFAGALEID